MNTAIKLLIGIVAAGAVVVVVAFALLSASLRNTSSYTATSTPNGSQTPNPTTVYVNDGSSGAATPTSKLTMGTTDGHVIEVNDFTKTSDYHPDPFNQGDYHLGYYPAEDGTFDAPYLIDYLSQTQAFNITIYEEPIGEVRQQAAPSLGNLPRPR